MKKAKTFWLVVGTLGTLSAAYAGFSSFESATQAAIDNQKAGNYVAAQADFREAATLAQTPEHKAQALRAAASAALSQGKSDEARRQWNAILEMPGVSADLKDGTRFLIGQSYVKDGRYEEARAIYNALLQNPSARTDATGRAMVRLLIAETYLSEKRYEEARQLLSAERQARENMPEFRAMVQLRIARSFADEGKFAEARRENDALLALPLEASLSLEQRRKIRAVQANARVQRGDTFLAEGNRGAARAEYQKVLDAADSEPYIEVSRIAARGQLAALDLAQQTDSPVYRSYEEASIAARQSAEKGEFAAARGALQQARVLAVRPTQKVVAQQRLGETFRREGNRAAAVAEWRQVFQIDGLSATDRKGTHLLLASVLMEENEPAKARAELQAVLADPTPPSSPIERANVLLALSATYQREKRNAQAREPLKELLATPNLPLPLVALAHFGLAQTFLAEKNAPAARAELNTILGLNAALLPANQRNNLLANQSQALVSLGDAYALGGNSKAAQAAYQKALLLPQLPPDGRAKALARLKQTAKP